MSMNNGPSMRERGPQLPTISCVGRTVLAAAVVGIGVGAYLLGRDTAPSPSGVITVGGTAYCPKGEQPEGVYAHDDANTGHFLSWAPVAGTPNAMQFDGTLSGDPHAVTFSIGCGGSPESWAHSDRTAAFATDVANIGHLTFQCQDLPGTQGNNGTLDGSCTVVQP